MSDQKTINNILVVRTDRIGDVVLSTPVFEVLRKQFATAHISVLVTPKTREIVEGNPFIDEVLTFDKDGEHRSWWKTFLFSRQLRKKRFDIAVILHTTNRVVLLSYLAGIPERIGYERRLAFLLTKRFADSKKAGQLHEIDGNLELLKKGLGIQDLEYTCLYFPLREIPKQTVQERIDSCKLERKQYVAIHAQASCPSKCWPKTYFRDLIQQIVANLKLAVVIVGGVLDEEIIKGLPPQVTESVYNLSGKLSIGELGWVLKWARVFVSNDSGPVHISVAVNTPCISLFGRKDPGLSPRRWRPIGEHDIVFHKDVGCEACLAHNCIRQLQCLRSVTPDEVYEKVEELMRDVQLTDKE